MKEFGSIKPVMPKISGNITSNDIPAISGSIRSDVSIKGSVKGQLFEQYEGDYLVTPLAFESQKLKTKNKLLNSDITVLEIPYYETSNVSGQTVYIGNKEDMNGLQ